MEEKADPTQISCELKIPVPWGHIAAKSWNDPCGSPVIAVHGLQDNAGTFDRLIPLLPSSFYFVGIDLPGHGCSSHFPKGIPLNFMNFVTVIKRVMDHLNWEKCTYMGHSLGGNIGSFFSALFPEKVSKLIVIDALSRPVLSTHSLLKRHRILFEKTVSLEEKLSSRPAPAYTYEQALQRVVENRRSKVTQDAAAALIKRSLVSTADGYRFTTDQRLKFGLQPFFYVEQHLEMIENISCPVLVFLASESVEFFQFQVNEAIIQAYKAKPNFIFTTVDGNHDVHNNYPDRLVPDITKFLTAIKSSL